jgi:hypothetical protein
MQKKNNHINDSDTELYHYNCNGYDFLIHKDRANHKYIQKLKISDNVYRYFYTQEELDAYLAKNADRDGDMTDKQANKVANMKNLDVLGRFRPAQAIHDLFDEDFTVDGTKYQKKGTISTTSEAVKKQIDNTLRDGQKFLANFLKNLGL